ncbi:hypothetical protein [Pseudonocardia sp.]|uniref:hypothetical protein n=1 Tax=Pseudonocardia sp. TaxID=60912 RepID=UPI003D11626B
MHDGDEGRDRDVAGPSETPRPAPDGGPGHDPERTQPALDRAGDAPGGAEGRTPPERVPWSPDPGADPAPASSEPAPWGSDGRQEAGHAAPAGTEGGSEVEEPPAPAEPQARAATAEEPTADLRQLPEPRTPGEGSPAEEPTAVLPLPSEPGTPQDEPPAEEPPPAERLVIALADGPTLRDVAARAPMRAGEVARIGSELATVLAHLHHRGHAHGAVSPANVVLAPRGQPQLVDVGDGAGARPADDVHDLGLVLLTALNGSDSGVVPTDVPRPLRRVLLAATDADPTRRPTARQMVDMLAWVARDDHPGAPPEPGPRRGWSAGWAVGVGALLLVLLGLAAVAVLRENPDPAANPTVPTSEPAPAPAPEPTPVPTSAPTSVAVPEPTPSVAPPVPTPTPTVPVPTETPAVPETPVLPTALPTSLPALPTGLPTALPTTLPTIDVPTALPELPDVPDLPSEAGGLWDRFVEWVKSLF